MQLVRSEESSTTLSHPKWSKAVDDVLQLVTDSITQTSRIVELRLNFGERE
jgi:hypothetical protein